MGGARGSAAGRMSPRVGRVRARLLSAPLEVCVERARHFTRAMSENWEKHPLTRMSIGLAWVLDRVQVEIRDEELIVGCRSSRPRGAPLFPELRSRWLEAELCRPPGRAFNGAALGEAEALELSRDILPFWRGRSVEDGFQREAPGGFELAQGRGRFSLGSRLQFGIGSILLDHARGLREGLSGVMVRAYERKEAMSREEKEGTKGLFYDAVNRSLSAAIRFSNRYADLAETMAVSEPDPRRSAELIGIAEVCRHVPERPARNFQEALQFIFFLHLIARLETPGLGVSPGRLDVILDPYYQMDLEAGRITPERATELIALFFIKLNEAVDVGAEAYVPFGVGAELAPAQNVTVGGLAGEGGGVNDLSFLVLEAHALLGLQQPILNARLSSDAPSDFALQAATAVMAGAPIRFFNDPATVGALVAGGVDAAVAEDYAAAGRGSPACPGKSADSSRAAVLDGPGLLAAALEDFAGGGKEAGPRAAAFEELYRGLEARLEQELSLLAETLLALDRCLAGLKPMPLISALLEGPLEIGLDVSFGGARVDLAGVSLAGFPQLIDELYAAKLALAPGGAGSGSGDAELEALVTRTLESFSAAVGRRRGLSGRPLRAGALGGGSELAAGRDERAGVEFVGEGLALAGPAGLRARLASIAAAPWSRLAGGFGLGIVVDPAACRSEELHDLIRGYFKAGGPSLLVSAVAPEAIEVGGPVPARLVGAGGVVVFLSRLAPAARRALRAWISGAR